MFGNVWKKKITLLEGVRPLRNLDNSILNDSRLIQIQDSIESDWQFNRTGKGPFGKNLQVERIFKFDAFEIVGIVCGGITVFTRSWSLPVVSRCCEFKESDNHCDGVITFANHGDSLSFQFEFFDCESYFMTVRAERHTQHMRHRSLQRKSFLGYKWKFLLDSKDFYSCASLSHHIRVSAERFI